MLKKGFQKVWWLELIVLAVLLMASFTQILIEEIFGKDNSAFLGFVTDISLVIPCIIGCIMLKSGDRAVTYSDIGLVPLKHEYILYSVFLPLFFQSFCIITTLPAELILNCLFGSDIPEIDMPKNVLEGIFTIGSICVLAPLFEEFIFRGIMVRLMHNYSFVAVMITTSAAFALQHMDMSGIIQYFFLGMLLFILRYTTGSLTASVIAHAMINLSAFLSVYAQENALSSVETLSSVMMIGSFVIVPLLFRHFLRLTEIIEGWRKNVKIKGEKIGISAALIIFAVIYTIWNASILTDNIKSGYTQRTFAETFENTADTAEEDIS